MTPIALLKAGISIMETPIVQRTISERERRYIEAINFNELKQCINLLKEYKGLKS